MRSSLEIAQAHRLRPIDEIAAAAGLLPEEIEPYGRTKAKIRLSAIERLADRPDARIIDVTAITPTPAGEGKTTTSVSLTQGLGAIGKRPVLALREPSLGPIFGIKGGAAGGGLAQVVPMEDINLHFTGDIHAISAANNLLAAFLDAHLLHGNEADIDPLTVSWRRVVDMNDRNLREIVTGLGGKANGIPRETGFDITAASEVMAILSLSRDLGDLRARLGRITVGYDRSGAPVTADQIKAAGAMAVLLKDALMPNLVQTLEGQPTLMHAGPFANIAHGNNSLVADLLGLKLGDYLVTESGFAADMGMQKFMDIVCRTGGLKPSAVVLVATVRALQMHGGGGLTRPDSQAEGLRLLEAGIPNLHHHLGLIRLYGVEPVVAVNRMPGDSDAEIDALQRLAEEAGAFGVAVNEGFTKGGPGAAELAELAVAACDAPHEFGVLYPDDIPITEKIEIIATKVYGADGVDYAPEAEQKLALFTEQGYSGFPICMAKTHLSISADPTLKGRPRGFRLPIRDVRAYTGAGFLVPLAGEMRQMPGLGKSPAGFNVDLDAEGTIIGLF